MNAVLSRNAPRIDQRAVIARRHLPYASMDYAVAGNALQLVSEELCETVNLCQDLRVLDVAAGNFACLARRRAPLVRGDRHGPCHGPGSTRRQRLEAESVGVRFVDGDVDGAAFRRPELRCRVVLFRCDVRRRPGARCVRDDPRVPARRAGRPHQLDAGRFHRPAVQDRDQACAAGRGRHTLRLGHSGAHRGIVWRLRRHRSGRQAGRLP